VDCQDIKYLKRRSVRNSPGHVAGLLLLFGLVLGVWHRSASSLHHRQAEHARQMRLRGDLLFAAQGRHLEDIFGAERKALSSSSSLAERTARERLLTQWLDQLDQEIRNNVRGGVRWIRPYLLPPLDGSQDDTGSDESDVKHRKGDDRKDHPNRNRFLNVNRARTVMKWESEWERMLKSGKPIPGPAVDYTDRNKYAYPEILPDVPPASAYPPLRPLGELMKEWNHDEDNLGTIRESLQHFNYSDPIQLAMAVRYREAEVPFKLYDVPEVREASRKWTDQYVAAGFMSPAASGHAQESPNNYFAFFVPRNWVVNSLGLVPVRISYSLPSLERKSGAEKTVAELPLMTLA
jgi:hypothetical protein